MNDYSDDYDEGYLNFRPYRLELQGSSEIRIFLTDSEIREKLEKEEETEDDEENS